MTRNQLTTTIAALLISLPLIAHSGPNTIDTSIMMEDQSAHDFATTIAQFEEAVDDAGWAIITTHNMQQTLQRHGHDVESIKVFELCSAKYSAKILELDDERVVSPLMPCRVSIYKKSDGHTYISRMDNTKIARPFGGVVEEVMTQATNDIEDILSGLIR